MQKNLLLNKSEQRVDPPPVCCSHRSISKLSNLFLHTFSLIYIMYILNKYIQNECKIRIQLHLMKVQAGCMMIVDIIK